MTILQEELKRLVRLVIDEVDCDDQAALTSILSQLRCVAEEDHLNFERAVGQTTPARAA